MARDDKSLCVSTWRYSHKCGRGEPMTPSLMAGPWGPSLRGALTSLGASSPFLLECQQLLRGHDGAQVRVRVGG